MKYGTLAPWFTPWEGRKSSKELAAQWQISWSQAKRQLQKLIKLELVTAYTQWTGKMSHHPVYEITNKIALYVMIMDGASAVGERGEHDECGCPEHQKAEAELHAVGDALTHVASSCYSVMGIMHNSFQQSQSEAFMASVCVARDVEMLTHEQYTEAMIATGDLYRATAEKVRLLATETSERMATLILTKLKPRHPRRLGSALEDALFSLVCHELAHRLIGESRENALQLRSAYYEKLEANNDKE